jgi:hypothetical protein
MNGVEHARPYLNYPYGYIGQGEYGYALGDILRPIPVKTEQANTGDFPRNIQEHFWIYAGENDGDSWLSCGALANGNYFFYTGGCDYTGFDCQGGMSLWVSSSWKTIVDHAMTSADYELYEEQTKVPPIIAAGQEPWPILSSEEFWAAQRVSTECAECHEGGATMEYNHQQLCADCFWDVREIDRRAQ